MLALDYGFASSGEVMQAAIADRRRLAYSQPWIRPTMKVLPALSGALISPLA